MPQIKLTGIEPGEPYVVEAAKSVFTSLFRLTGYPTLNSEVIEVVIDRDHPTPMYVLGSVEKIIVCPEHNRPWQFAYQLAHELGHLAARALSRFPRQDGNMWIEEALCECCSLIALDRMRSDHAPLSDGAIIYYAELLRRNDGVKVTREWLYEAMPALHAASALTLDAQIVARRLVMSVDYDRILEDNMRLALVPVGLPNKQFLEQWSEMGPGGEGVPEILAKLFAGA